MKTARSHWTATDADAGVRLDKFLAAPDRLASRGKAVAALERGKVYVNDDEVDIKEAARRLVAGDVVRVWADRPGSARPRPRTGPTGDLDVVYEDDALLVVNKPSGMLSVPLERNPDVPSVYDQIARRFRSHGKRRPFVVHRIDQDTSGLVVFAKDPTSQQRLKTQFARRQPERIYLAVVYGHPTPPEGTWRDVLVWDTKALIQKETHRRDPRGTEAIAEYRVVERFHEASLVEVRLRTGGGIRSAFRRDCAAIRWLVKSAMSTDRTSCARFRSAGRRCTRFVSSSSTPPMGGQWYSRRLRLPIWKTSSRDFGVRREGKWLFGVDSEGQPLHPSGVRACATARFVVFSR